jgi:hypothetical protein
MKGNLTMPTTEYESEQRVREAGAIICAIILLALLSLVLAGAGHTLGKLASGTTVKDAKATTRR